MEQSEKLIRAIEGLTNAQRGSNVAFSLRAKKSLRIIFEEYNDKRPPFVFEGESEVVAFKDSNMILFKLGAKEDSPISLIAKADIKEIALDKELGSE